MGNQLMGPQPQILIWDSLLSGKLFATRDMGYFLPLLKQNFCFSSAHCAKIAKLARSSLKQSQFSGSNCWEKTTKFCETLLKTTHIPKIYRCKLTTGQ